MKKRTIKILIFVGIALLFWIISGILFGARGKVQGNIERQKEVCNELTDATVIQVKRTREKVNGEYVFRWHPVYEYYVDGVRYEKESTSYYKLGVFEEGDQVDIYYNPDKPEEMYVPVEKPEKVIMILTILMVAFFFAGFLVLGIMFANIKSR